MGSFEDHVNYGVAAHLVVIATALGLVYTGVIPPVTAGAAIVLFPLTLLGAIFPDIDHKHAKPYRIFRKTASVIAGFGMAVLWYTYNDLLSVLVTRTPIETDVSVVAGMLIVVFSVLSGSLTWWLIDIVRPKHRGVTHRIPTGLLLSGAIVLLFDALFVTLFTEHLSFAIVAGGCFFFGFLSHLYCDGMLTERKTYFTLR